MLRLSLIAALLLAAATPAAATHGPALPLPEQLCREPGGQSDSPPQARLRRAKVAGVPVAVVLPVGYDGVQRYPVVYLLHGAQGDEDSWIEYGDLMATTAKQARSQRAIVVMPKLGVITGFAVDWADGFRQDATFLSSTLVRWADRTLRTVPDRRHRAIAGYSGGGLSAAHVAERAPSVFGQLGVLSGPTTLVDPAASIVTWAALVAEQICAGDDVTAQGMLGNPVQQSAQWEAADPTRHAARLRQTWVYISSGNGLPCGLTDAANLTNPTAATEPQLRRASDAFDSALTAAGVRHLYDRRSCGLHWWTLWRPQLDAFWAGASRQWTRR